MKETYSLIMYIKHVNSLSHILKSQIHTQDFHLDNTVLSTQLSKTES